MRLRGIVIALPALLGACGTYDAYRARTGLVGADEPGIWACMGTADHLQYISPGRHVATWIYAQTGTDLQAEAGVYSIKLGQPGVCHASIAFDRGRVTAVHYEDADVGPASVDSICGRIVHDCMAHPMRGDLPADFDPDAIVLGPPPPGAPAH